MLRRLLDGSGVSREAPAPFCERPEVKFLRPTLQTAVRDRVHGFIQAMIEAELEEALSRTRYARHTQITSYIPFKLFGLSHPFAQNRFPSPLSRGHAFLGTMLYCQPMPFTLRQLQYFVAVAQKGSVSGAAQ